MDFLLSYRSFKHFVELKPTKPIESSHSYSYFSSYLLLTVEGYTWRLLMTLTIFLRIFITIYTITFTQGKKTLFWFDYINIMLDILFVFDFISALMYRLYYPKRSTPPEMLKTELKRLVWRNKLYNPRKIWMFIIDIITMIPFELLRFLVPLHGDFRLICYYVPVLRIYRPIVFRFESMKRIFFETNLILKLVIKYGMVWLMAMQIFACIYRWVAWHKGSNFIKNIDAALSFDKNEPFNYFLIILYVVQFSFENIGFGDLPPTTDGERILIIITTLVGFSILNGYIISFLTNALAEKLRRITVFRLRLSLMTNELSYKKVPKEKIQNVKEFYHSLWTFRKGVGPSDALLVSLPDSIWGSVYYDTFQVALNASLLFRSCDESSKRAIARVMKTESYMAGDVILRRCQRNSSMFYIKKGTIEILSYEDDETPIMTFGAGSIFGQIALLLSLPSISQVQAVTFCEIQMLTRKKLLRILKDYPKAKDIIFNVHKNMLLNAMADKFYPSPGDKPKNILHNNSFYKVPKETSKVAQNDICAVRNCPYVFEPNTIFLKLWDALVAAVIVVICFVYPYYAAFVRKYPTEAEPFIIVSDIILILNTYLAFSTAVVKENILFLSVREISISKLTNVFTYLDIMAVMPLHYFIRNNSRVKPVVLCLRCLEIYKIHFLFVKAETSVRTEIIGFLRLIKCVLYFFFIGYIVGILFYLEACYEDPCVYNSWYVNNNVTQSVQSPVWASLYIAILLVSETGFGDILPKNITDVVFIINFCFFGAFLFIFLRSEYSAYLSLNREPLVNFLDFAKGINSFLVAHNVSQNEIVRVRQCLNLQWEWNKGYEFTDNKNTKIFYNFSSRMINGFGQYTNFVRFQSLSAFFSADTVNSVLSSANSVIFPPHEVVIYAGDICEAVLVLQEGFCEITCGKDVSVKKIISAGEELCTVEIILGLTSLCHVRTLTHCIFIKIPKEALIGVLKLYPVIYLEIIEAVAKFEKTQIFQDIQKARPIHLQLVVHSTVPKSLSRLHYIQKRAENEEFKAPFVKLGLCQWIRFFLGRTTILPFGKLLKTWELSRCLFAFSSAILFPLLPYFELQVPALFYIGLFLDISAWIDLYFRAHVCYYNQKNLLVSHPLYTSTHYLKGSFILDFTFCFPFDRIMFQRVYDNEGYAEVTNRPINILRLFRILQIYRITPAVNNMGDFLSAPTLTRMSIMLAAFTIIFLNTWTSILILYCFNYKVDRENKYVIQITPYCRKHYTRIQKNFNTTDQPFSIYTVDFYWVAGTVFSVGYGDITAETTEHMIFVVCMIIISYLFLSFLTVLLVSYLSSVNRNLTIYQTRMGNLIRFLKSENVNPLLRKHVRSHFENTWKETKGMKAQSVFNNFYPALRGDVLLHLYEDTLKGVGAFSNMNQSFIRILCSQVQESNYIAGAQIYKARDALSDIYIISQGRVALIGKNGNETVTLGPSEIFGHLENVPRGLANESVVARNNITILTISTTVLYKSYIDFSAAAGENKQAQEQTLRKALEKSNELKSSEHLAMFQKAEIKKTFAYVTYLISKYTRILYLILSWFSINEVSYSAAFQSHSVTFIYIALPIEILFAFKIFLGFTTGFVDKRGEFISDYRRIRRRYIKSIGFYVDLFSMIPFYLIALAFKKKDRLYGLLILRVTKYLRVWNIHQFFSSKFEALSVNMTFLKMMNVTIWSVTFLHQCACIWYFVSCPRSHCPASVTWNIIHKGFYSTYLTSLYFVVVLLTSTGTGDVTPHTPIEFALTIIFMIFAFFQAAIFTGGITSTISKYLLAKTNYEYATFSLKTYLSVNDVPFETQKRVFRYVTNIWCHQKGQQIPKLLKNGPPYLLHEMKQSTYGYHINDNPVFKTCNPSFRKLIINELRRTVYFTGDVIVYEGEVNRTMYFVHVGLVESKAQAKELQQNIYPTGKFFGMKQGAYTREPHLMTYTALTFCIILSLNLKHWQYLSEFYPEDMQHILKKTKDI